MAFNGIRFASLEWKNLVSSKVMWVVTGAIAIIPLLYCALYLAAFQDPYERLSRIPVAVVNSDQGAWIDGEYRTVGDEVVSELKTTSNGLGWHFVSADEAQRGLEDGTYFMLCTIPKDFSQSIASAEVADPQRAQLLVEYNQGANMLASQVGKTAWLEVRDRVNASVAKEYWAAAFARIADTASELQTAACGAGELTDGLRSAQQGNDAITEGLATLSAGSAQLASGLDRMEASASDLSGNLSLLSGQVSALANGASGALSSAAGGLNEAEAGLTELAAGLSSLAAAAEAEGGSESPEAQAAVELAANAQAIASSLASAQTQLKSAASELHGDALAVAAGAEGLQAAVPELTAGMESAAAGAQRVQIGAERLEAGSAALGEGLATATDGAAELALRLDEGAEEAATQSADAAARSSMMSQPVALEESYYTRVADYGSGFAPYFIGLALWVGGLVAGFVFKPLNGRLVLSGAHPVTAAFANYLPYALFACIQATLLMLVVQFGLKLQIDHVAEFYAVGYLTALTFAAIMQLLAAALGVPGRFVAIILLMLQLTSSAGTFPVQTTPAFFQAVNPFVPMTYVVQALRQAMAGLDMALLAQSCAVLAMFGVACFVLTCVVAHARRTVRMDDLHPLIQLN